MDFDENNDEFMSALAASMVTLVPHIFPGEIAVDTYKLQLNYDTEARVDPQFKAQLINVIDRCMGPLYIDKKGSQWKTEKLQELNTPGLVFVWYEQDLTPVCFISFKMCEEPYGQCLYLYEIQVLPCAQGHSVGSTLLQSFHGLSKLLNSLSTLPDLQHFENSFTSLTVFADNHQALSWYMRNAYKQAPDSPSDRTMRNGKVIKPDYYLLYRSQK